MGKKNFILIFVLMMTAFAEVSAQNTYEECISAGQKAASADSLEQAEKFFRKALALSPSDYRNALVFTDLGRVQERMGHDKDAVESYTMALNSAPLSVPILMARANLYLRIGKFNSAYVDYCSVIDVDPNNIEALMFRAYACMERRDYNSAKMDYEKVIAKEPDNYTARLGLAVLLQKMNRLNESLEKMELLDNQYPDKAELYSVKADMEVEKKLPELAIMDLSKAVELDPKNRNYVLARAYLYLEQGKKRLARQDFERAIELGVDRGSLSEEFKALK